MANSDRKGNYAANNTQEKKMTQKDLYMYKYGRPDSEVMGDVGSGQRK